MTSADEPWGNAVLIDGETGERSEPAGVFALPGDEGSVGLAFLFSDNSIRSAETFLNLLAAEIPVALLDPQTKTEQIHSLLAAYRPEVVFFPPESTIAHALSRENGALVEPGLWRSGQSAGPVHPGLAVLLFTSGSTGSPKTVRLSRENVVSNARGIAQALGLRRDDRAITTLPMHYSFGMSVITSHAAVGSPIVVSDRSVIELPFWEMAESRGVTFLAGVPQTYEMLRRLRLENRFPGSLRAMIQAGGRLQQNTIEHFFDLMSSRDGQFHVMYGQTEAAPRMSCLPPESLATKIGSVGLPLPGGRFEIRDEIGLALPSGAIGEVVYRGPNVMLGYAEKRSDLALGDVAGGELATGDLGYLDDEGFLFITGRMKRIAKVAGVRISLDDVEILAVSLGLAAAVSDGDEGVALFQIDAEAPARFDLRRLAADLNLHPKFLRLIGLDALPTLPSGKVDYKRLSAIAEETR